MSSPKIIQSYCLQKFLVFNCSTSFHLIRSCYQCLKSPAHILGLLSPATASILSVTTLVQNLPIMRMSKLKSTPKSMEVSEWSRLRGPPSFRPSHSGVKKRRSSGKAFNIATAGQGDRGTPRSNLKTRQNAIRGLDKELPQQSSSPITRHYSIECLLYTALVGVHYRKVANYLITNRPLSTDIYYPALMGQIYQQLHIACGIWTPQNPIISNCKRIRPAQRTIEYIIGT